jgi:hypothetical protein
MMMMMVMMMVVVVVVVVVVVINRIFVCAVWTFMITGDENVGSAVTNPSPQSQGQFRLHIRKNWHCYRLYLWVVYSSIVYLILWMSLFICTPSLC